MNKFDQMVDGVQEAQRTLKAADLVVSDLAILLVGRLRKVTSWRGSAALCDLKKELRSFNMRTEEWRD